MGSWVLYGLGAETDNLPGFVVLASQGNGGQMQPIAARQWSAGTLPSRFQGVRFNSVGDAVLYISNPPGVSRDMQKDSIQAINALNGVYDRSAHDPELQTRIAQYEMAFRMQSSVPGLADMPAAQRPMVDIARVRALDPAGVRQYVGDGNFGGLYQRSDDEMLALWEIAVDETRALLNGSWGDAP